MELKEKLKKIMAEEYGIHTDAELDRAFEQIDTSIFAMFSEKEGEKSNG